MATMATTSKAVEFFELICCGDPHDSAVSWVLLPDKSNDTRASSFLHASFERAQGILQRKNQEGFGIFYLVNKGDGQGRKSDNIRRVRALFADLDNSESREKFFSFQLEPHAVVETSPGKFHQYWLVDDVELNEFSLLQKRIAKTLGTDSTISNLARVMRAPGFLHQKDRPFSSRVITLNEGLPAYSKVDFEPLLEVLEAPAPSSAGGGGLCDISLEEAGRALSYLPDEYADDHERWLKVIMAIHSEFGSAGESLAAEFSMRSAKFDENAFLKRYRSFTPGGGITFRSVIYDAMHHGYIQTLSAEVDSGDDFSEALNSMLRNITARQKKRELIVPASLAGRAPGLVGELASWITETAFLPQPVLSLGAALSLVGTLKGHRVKTETDLRTNLYICGLASSGSGKNHPLKAVSRLLVAAGQEQLFAGKPASDSGLIKLLADGQGRRVILYDEFGKVLSRLTDQRSGTYQKAIVETMMELFSSASSIYLGKEYANHDGRMGRLDVNQPCLSVFAVSTINRFYEALSKGLAADGFLARWLVLEVENVDVKRNKNNVGAIPPDYFIDEITRICNMPTAPVIEGNMAALNIKPRLVPFEDSARDLVDDLDSYYRVKARDAGISSDALASIYQRAAEHIQKVALVLSDNSSITLKDVDYAAELVGISVESLARATDERIAESPRESNRKALLAFIKNSGSTGATRTEIVRGFQSIKALERKELLSDLVEGGLVKQVVESSSSGKGRKRTIFVANGL